MTSEIAFAKRHGSALSLLMMDFDHFKRVNDTHGHQAGDHVLKTVAAVVRRTVRVEDVVARYGGEEFAIIARSTDLSQSMILAERVRSTVEKTRIEFEGKVIPMTVSIGVASTSCCVGAVTVEQLVTIADRRLYACKAAGRNRAIGTG
jgi:diguanylate cyclase (GGDEF)-like protein